MITFHPVAFREFIQSRRSYLKTLAAPLDGMWEDAFFANGEHWGIQVEGKRVGICGANGEQALLGFQIFDRRPREGIFRACLQELGFKKACVSTAEPAYLSLCLGLHASIEINALMYEDDGLEAEPGLFPPGAKYLPISMRDFDAAVSFGLDAIGAERDWLEGYYAERIEKQELFGLWRDKVLIGAGELRISPSQSGVADVGMVVAPEARKQGIATQILRQLRHDGRKRGLRVVCSTEAENLAAQTAIERAGFYSEHKILQITFAPAV